MNFKDTPGFKLAHITKLKRQLLDVYLEPYGLSRTQYLVFIWLEILGCPTFQKDLLQHIDIDAAHLTRVLEQLETDKYIKRYCVENNRRALAIQCTKKGKDFIRFIQTAIEKETEVIFCGFTNKEKNEFIKLLNKVERNLQSHGVNL